MNKFFTNVFGWLFLGLLVTFASSYLSITQGYINLFFANASYWILFIAQIGICIALTAFINKLPPIAAKVLYLGYAFLTGLTLSVVLLMYNVGTIIFVLLATSIVFGIFALIGKFTKVDLSKFGMILFIALIAIIVLELINIFVASNALDMVSCIAGLLIFMGYIVYDINMIKRLEYVENENMAIYGAFQLYLDFINVFIRLLEIFGRRRD